MAKQIQREHVNMMQDNKLIQMKKMDMGKLNGI